MNYLARQLWRQGWELDEAYRFLIQEGERLGMLEFVADMKAERCEWCK